MSQVLPPDPDDLIPEPPPPIGQHSDITHEIFGNLTISDGLNVSGMDVGPGLIRTNTPLGLDTIKLNQTGYNNTSVGFRSMRYLISGDSNSVLGYKGLYSNTSGSGNTALGAKALYSNVTGDRNVAVGESAGLNITGSKNTAVGENSQVSAGVNHSSAIGSDSSVTTDNTLSIGSVDDVVVIGGTARDSALSSNKLQVYGGDSAVCTAGFGIAIKEGSNCRQGLVTLSGGSASVANSAVTDKSRIFLTHQNISGIPGILCVSSISPGVGFTITAYGSTGGGGTVDTSVVAYLISNAA